MFCRLVGASIIWTDGVLLSIGPLGTNFNEILIENAFENVVSIQENAFGNVVRKMASICVGPNVLNYTNKYNKPRCRCGNFSLQIYQT